MSETGAAYAAGTVLGLVLYVAMVVGGALLVVSARRSSARARQQVTSHTSGTAPNRGRAKLVAGVVLLVLGLLLLLGRCAAVVGSAGV